MTLLNVERIKLFSTRSPYWCLALIPALGILITLLISLSSDGLFASLEASQQWVGFAQSVVMVMSALAITTEYRFGTIRNSFLGAPRRTGVLLAKATLLAALSFVIVAVTTVITYYLARNVHGRLAPGDAFDVLGAADWRVLWGPAVIGALSAVLAVAVGALVRQSAGAIAILLLWPLLVENLFQLFGDFGRNVFPWLPFQAGNRLWAGDASVGQPFDPDITVPNWWQGGLVFAGTAFLLLGISWVLIKRRDA